MYVWLYLYTYIHKICIQIYISNQTKLKQETNFKYTILRIFCSDMKIRKMRIKFFFIHYQHNSKEKLETLKIFSLEILTLITQQWTQVALYHKLFVKFCLAHQAVSQCWLHFQGPRSQYHNNKLKDLYLTQTACLNFLLQEIQNLDRNSLGWSPEWTNYVLVRYGMAMCQKSKEKLVSKKWRNKLHSGKSKREENTRPRFLKA